MSDTDLILEMRRRVRTHLLTSLGGILLGILVIGVGGGVLRALGVPAAAAVGLSALGIAVIPAVGFWSTFKNLRCPSCERRVIVEMSWNYSLFAAAAPKNCPGCGKQIFSHQAGRQFLRIMLIVLGAAFTLMFLGGLGAYNAQRAKSRAQNPPAQQR